IGIHFFSPVERMPLVEIIRGEKTGPQALATAIDYVGKIRKTPIVVNDSRGFYTSRCFGTYVNEGLTMIAEGVNPALVENAGRMAGMPMGPMEVADSVGLDTAHKIRKQTREDLGDASAGGPAGDLTEWIVEKHDRVGRKAGKGFYEYGEDGKPSRIWPAVYNYADKPHAEPDVEEVKKRLLYIQALETARCFEEGVLEDVRDGDVGSIFGWGFAPYTGGTLSLIDTVGAKRFVEECERMAAEYGERFKPNALLKEMAQKGETFYGRFNPQAKAAA
ncbi:MAG: 3-hydroxyacyl-CoA dehydrogenase family protein, partial [Alphaproteobacteria bacterium]